MTRYSHLVSYSKIDDHEKWGIEGFTCVSPEDAKKAEEFFNSLQYEIDKLKEENRILREGLGFYADSYTWVSNSGKIGINPIDKDMENIPGTQGSDRYCGGKKARETLNKADKVGKVKV